MNFFQEVIQFIKNTKISESRMKILWILLFGLVLFFAGCSTTTKSVHHKEKYYQTKLCNRLDGVMEYRLPDRTRVDCLSDDYAIEVDFAKKWAESIGQSLYYADMTGKKPAVGLIVGSKDKRFEKRLNRIAKKYNIKVFLIKK
jgi:hypothetical protein